MAEDNDDGRGMLEILLRMKGYDTIGAKDGLQAIEMTLRQRPRLILLDFELPVLNGLAVTRWLRRLAQFNQVPIVMISGHDPRTHREEALAAGCQDYLLKPIDFAALEEILASAVPISRVKAMRARAQSA